MTTYTWRPRGVPRHVATPGKNVRLAVCGACRWPDGPFLFHHGLRSVDTACFLGLVVRLARRARATKKPIVLVLDNASAHTSARSTRVLKELRALVQPFWLPLYSSELLNEIEPVWGHLKEDYFSQMSTRPSPSSRLCPSRGPSETPSSRGSARAWERSSAGSLRS
ncbi:MAG: transposase [Planctomycetota bacterium]